MSKGSICMWCLAAGNKDLREYVREVKWQRRPFYLLSLVHSYWIVCVCGLLVGSDELSVFCSFFLPLPPFSLWLTVMFHHHSFFSPLWTQCTTSCGPGYQMRAVKCVVGSYGAVMDDTECNAATRPTDTQVRRTFSRLPLFSLCLSSSFYVSEMLTVSLLCLHCESTLSTDSFCEGENPRACAPTLKTHTDKHTHFISTWSQ